MTTHAGFDHRSIFPPFFPVGHNDDGVFVELLMALVPDALVGQVPWAVRHKPPNHRPVSLAEVKRIVPSMSAFVGLVFHEFRQLPVVEAPRDAMRRAGALFQSFGNLSDDDFADLIRMNWNRYLAEQFSIHSELLDRYDGLPQFWAEQVEDMLDGIEQQLESPAFPLPVELVGSPYGADGVAICRRLFLDYGNVLVWWPDLWDTALELKQAGIRPTVPFR
jgi:hypothetical protein